MPLFGFQTITHFDPCIAKLAGTSGADNVCADFIGCDDLRGKNPLISAT